MSDANSSSPHKAVILINVSVYDVLPTGECSGRPVSAAELKTYGLASKIKKTVNGFDRHECLRKLKAIVDQLETK